MCKKNRCLILSVISALIGIIVGVLIFVGIIATALLQIPLIFVVAFAGLALILLFLASVFADKREAKECVCENGICLTIGTIGTLITSIIALTLLATLAAGSIGTAILLGLVTFFFILTLLNFIGLILCLIKSILRKEKCEEEYTNKFENDYMNKY